MLTPNGDVRSSELRYRSARLGHRRRTIAMTDVGNVSFEPQRYEEHHVHSLKCHVEYLNRLPAGVPHYAPGWDAFQYFDGVPPAWFPLFPALQGWVEMASPRLRDWECVQYTDARSVIERLASR